MNRNKIIVTIFFLLACRQTGCLEMNLRYQWQDFQKHNYRFLFEKQHLVFLLKDQVTGDPVFEPVTGFACPYLLSGPFVKQGLLREMDNYPGYTNGSAVFKEPTALKLDTAMNKKENWALQLAALSGGCGFFLADNCNAGYQAGGFLSLPLFYHLLLLEMLFTASLPADTDLAALGKGEKSGTTGDTVIHAGGKFRIINPKLHFYLSVITSNSHMNATGYLSHLDLALKTGPVRPAVFLEFCSRDYLPPDRSQQDNWLKGELAVDFFPAAGIRLDNRYGIHLDHPGEQPGIYLPVKEFFSFNTRLILADRDSTELAVSSSLGKKMTYTSDGIITDTFNLDLSLDLDLENTGTHLRFRHKRTDNQVTARSLQADHYFRQKSCRFDLGLKWLTGEHPAFGGRIGFNINHINYSMNIRLATRSGNEISMENWNDFTAAPLDFLALTVTWETNKKYTPAG